MAYKYFFPTGDYTWVEDDVTEDVIFDHYSKTRPELYPSYNAMLGTTPVGEDPSEQGLFRDIVVDPFMSMFTSLPERGALPFQIASMYANATPEQMKDPRFLDPVREEIDNMPRELQKHTMRQAKELLDSGEVLGAGAEFGKSAIESMFSAAGYAAPTIAAGAVGSLAGTPALGYTAATAVSSTQFAAENLTEIIQNPESTLEDISNAFPKMAVATAAQTATEVGILKLFGLMPGASTLAKKALSPSLGKTTVKDQAVDFGLKAINKVRSLSPVGIALSGVAEGNAEVLQHLLTKWQAGVEMDFSEEDQMWELYENFAGGFFGGVGLRTGGIGVEKILEKGVLRGSETGKQEEFQLSQKERRDKEIEIEKKKNTDRLERENKKLKNLRATEERKVGEAAEAAREIFEVEDDDIHNILAERKINSRDGGFAKYINDMFPGKVSLESLDSREKFLLYESLKKFDVQKTTSDLTGRREVAPEKPEDKKLESRDLRKLGVSGRVYGLNVSAISLDRLKELKEAIELRSSKPYGVSLEESIESRNDFKSIEEWIDYKEKMESGLYEDGETLASFSSYSENDISNTLEFLRKKFKRHKVKEKTLTKDMLNDILNTEKYDDVISSSITESVLEELIERGVVRRELGVDFLSRMLKSSDPAVASEARDIIQYKALADRSGYTQEEADYIEQRYTDLYNEKSNFIVSDSFVNETNGKILDLASELKRIPSFEDIKNYTDIRSEESYNASIADLENSGIIYRDEVGELVLTSKVDNSLFKYSYNAKERKKFAVRDVEGRVVSLHDSKEAATDKASDLNNEYGGFEVIGSDGTVVKTLYGPGARDNAVNFVNDNRLKYSVIKDRVTVDSGLSKTQADALSRELQNEAGIKGAEARRRIKVNPEVGGVKFSIHEKDFLEPLPSGYTSSDSAENFFLVEESKTSTNGDYAGTSIVGLRRNIGSAIDKANELSLIRKSSIESIKGERRTDIEEGQTVEEYLLADAEGLSSAEVARRRKEAEILRRSRLEQSALEESTERLTKEQAYRLLTLKARVDGVLKRNADLGRETNPLKNPTKKELRDLRDDPEKFVRDRLEVIKRKRKSKEPAKVPSLLDDKRVKEAIRDLRKQYKLLGLEDVSDLEIVSTLEGSKRGSKGRTKGISGIIQIALDYATEGIDEKWTSKNILKRMLPVLGHETYHAYEANGFVTPKQSDRLTKFAKKTKFKDTKFAKRTKFKGTNESINDVIRKAYMEEKKWDPSDERLDQEVRAYVIELYIEERGWGVNKVASKEKVVTGPIASIVNRIVKFIKALGNYFRSSGFDSIEDIAEIFLPVADTKMSAVDIAMQKGRPLDRIKGSIYASGESIRGKKYLTGKGEGGRYVYKDELDREYELPEIVSIKDIEKAAELKDFDLASVDKRYIFDSGIHATASKIKDLNTRGMRKLHNRILGVPDEYSPETKKQSRQGEDIGFDSIVPFPTSLERNVPQDPDSWLGDSEFLKELSFVYWYSGAESSADSSKFLIAGQEFNREDVPYALHVIDYVVKSIETDHGTYPETNIQYRGPMRDVDTALYSENTVEYALEKSREGIDKYLNEELPRPESLPGPGFNDLSSQYIGKMIDLFSSGVHSLNENYFIGNMLRYIDFSRVTNQELSNVWDDYGHNLKISSKALDYLWYKFLQSDPEVYSSGMSSSTRPDLIFGKMFQPNLEDYINVFEVLDDMATAFIPGGLISARAEHGYQSYSGRETSLNRSDSTYNKVAQIFADLNMSNPSALALPSSIAPLQINPSMLSENVDIISGFLRSNPSLNARARELDVARERVTSEMEGRPELETLIEFTHEDQYVSFDGTESIRATSSFPRQINRERVRALEALENLDRVGFYDGLNSKWISGINKGNRFNKHRVEAFDTGRAYTNYGQRIAYTEVINDLNYIPSGNLSWLIPGKRYVYFVDVDRELYGFLNVSFDGTESIRDRQSKVLYAYDRSEMWSQGRYRTTPDGVRSRLHEGMVEQASNLNSRDSALQRATTGDISSRNFIDNISNDLLDVSQETEYIRTITSLERDMRDMSSEQRNRIDAAMLDIASDDLSQREALTQAVAAEQHAARVAAAEAAAEASEASAMRRRNRVDPGYVAGAEIAEEELQNLPRNTIEGRAEEALYGGLFESDIEEIEAIGHEDLKRTMRLRGVDPDVTSDKLSEILAISGKASIDELSESEMEDAFEYVSDNFRLLYIDNEDSDMDSLPAEDLVKKYGGITIRENTSFGEIKISLKNREDAHVVIKSKPQHQMTDMERAEEENFMLDDGIFEGTDSEYSRILKDLFNMLQVSGSEVPLELRGKGLGLRLYIEALRYAQDEGYGFKGDQFSISELAMNTWKRLKYAGVPVKFTKGKTVWSNDRSGLPAVSHSNYGVPYVLAEDLANLDIDAVFSYDPNQMLSSLGRIERESEIIDDGGSPVRIIGDVSVENIFKDNLFHRVDTSGGDNFMYLTSILENGLPPGRDISGVRGNEVKGSIVLVYNKKILRDTSPEGIRASPIAILFDPSRESGVSDLGTENDRLSKLKKISDEFGVPLLESYFSKDKGTTLLTRKILGNSSFKFPKVGGRPKLRYKKRGRVLDKPIKIVHPRKDQASLPSGREYDTKEKYEPGEIVVHKTLGKGVVQENISRNKISILFGNDIRIMLHNRTKPKPYVKSLDKDSIELGAENMLTGNFSDDSSRDMDSIDTRESRLLNDFVHDKMKELGSTLDGYCLKCATEFSFDIDGDFVEGVVFNKETGDAFLHAWAEKDGVVYDATNFKGLKPLSVKREDFNKASNAIELYRSTGEEAIARMLKKQEVSFVSSLDDIDRIEVTDEDIKNNIPVDLDSLNFIDAVDYTVEYPSKLFPDSKVRDAGGNLLMLSHASPIEDIESFLPYTHFGTPRAGSDVLASKKLSGLIEEDAEEFYHPVFLNMKDPMRLTDVSGWEDSTSILKAIISTYASSLRGNRLFPRTPLGSLDVLRGWPTDDHRQNELSWHQIELDHPKYVGRREEYIKDLIESLGFDGIIYENKYENVGSMSYMTISEDQVMSVEKAVESISGEEKLDTASMYKYVGGTGIRTVNTSQYDTDNKDSIDIGGRKPFVPENMRMDNIVLSDNSTKKIVTMLRNAKLKNIRNSEYKVETDKENREIIEQKLKYYKDYYDEFINNGIASMNELLSRKSKVFKTSTSGVKLKDLHLFLGEMQDAGVSTDYLFDLKNDIYNDIGIENEKINIRGMGRNLLYQDNGIRYNKETLVNETPFSNIDGLIEEIKNSNFNDIPKSTNLNATTSIFLNGPGYTNPIAVFIAPVNFRDMAIVEVSSNREYGVKNIEYSGVDSPPVHGPDATAETAIYFYNRNNKKGKAEQLDLKLDHDSVGYDPSVYTEEENAILRKVHSPQKSSFIKQLLSAFTGDEVLKKARNAFIHSHSPVERSGIALREKLRPEGIELETSEMAFADVILAQRANGVLAAAFKYGVPVFDKVKKFTQAKLGSFELKNRADMPPVYSQKYGGFIDIIHPLIDTIGIRDNLLNKFHVILVSRRAKRLESMGLRVPEGVDESYHSVADKFLAENPEMEVIIENFMEWNNKIVDMAVDMQLLSEGLGNELKRTMDYISFTREFTSEGLLDVDLLWQGSADPARRREGRMQDPQQPEKYAGGTEGKLRDFLGSVASNAYSLIQEGMNNVASASVVEEQRKLFGEEYIREAGAVDANGVKHNKVKDITNPNSITYRINGEKKTFVIPDGAVAQAMRGTIGVTDPFMEKFLAKFSKLLREGVTRSPTFMYRNTLKDAMMIYMMIDQEGDKQFMLPFRSIGNSIRHIFKGENYFNDEFLELESSGSAGGFELGTIYEPTANGLLKLMSKNSRGDISINPVKSFYKIWDGLGVASAKAEAAARIEVYKLTMKRSNNNIKESTIQAIEVLNYNRRGGNKSFQKILALMPFTSAGINGVDILYRKIKGELTIDPSLTKREVRMRMLTRMGYMFALGFGYAALWGELDDEEWKSYGEEVALDNFLIPIFGTDLSVAVPGPFELGWFALTLPQLLYRMIRDETYSVASGLKKAFQSAVRTLPAINYPQFAAPLINVGGIKGPWSESRGWNPFLGSTLIPEHIPVGQMAYTEKTGPIAKGISSIAGGSPIKWEHLYQYGGTMAINAMALADSFVRLLQPGDQIPGDWASDMDFWLRDPNVSAIVKKASDSGQMQKFYERYDAINELAYAIRTLNVENISKSREIQQDNKGLLAKTPTLRRAKKRLEKYSKRIKRVNNNNNISAKEKQKRIDVIKRHRKNDLNRVLELTNDLDIDLWGFTPYRD